MRSGLALCLLIALCASANAAARAHHAKSRHAIVRPSQSEIPSYITPGGVRIYRDDPLWVVCGPTTTTLQPTMTHPSLAAPDLRQPDYVYAKSLVCHGAKLGSGLIRKGIK